MSSVCPPDYGAAAQRRCAAARDGTLQPYGQMLRATALDVLHSMFPLFCDRRGAQALADDVDDFVRHGMAREAQFYHLSTEFLRHAQPRLDDPVARALLEYEWTQFTVELDPAHVPPPSARADGACRVNPTLRLVAMPFALDAAEPELQAERPPFLYAIYRTAGHEVATQPLDTLDVACLQRLQAGQPGGVDAASSARCQHAVHTGLFVVPHP